MTTTPTPQRPDARDLLDRIVKQLRAAKRTASPIQHPRICALLAECDALPAAPAVAPVNTAEGYVLPCATCGGSAFESATDGVWVINCTSCTDRVSAISRQMALAAWNSGRSPPDSATAPVHAQALGAFRPYVAPAVTDGAIRGWVVACTGRDPSSIHETEIADIRKLLDLAARNTRATLDRLASNLDAILFLTEKGRDDDVYHIAAEARAHVTTLAEELSNPICSDHACPEDNLHNVNDCPPASASMSAGVTAERVVELVEDAIDRMEDAYPKSVFPEESESLDSRSAQMARITCRNVRRTFREMLAEERAEVAERACANTRAGVDGGMAQLAPDELTAGDAKGATTSTETIRTAHASLRGEDTK